MTDAIPRALVRAQVALEAFRLLPDGSGVVYVLRRVRREDYESHLWMRPLRGGRPRQLTRGRVRDVGPAISPDGRHVAFVRTPVGDDDAVAQAWVLPLDGGEPWQLTSLKHGVGAVHWSPDGSRLALEAQAGDHRFVVGEERKGRSPIARRITRLDFRDDESGHVVRRSHLWLMPFRAGAAPRQLTSGDFDVLHPAWSPDGRRIAFAADRGPDATINPRLQIWSVGTDAAKPRVRELASLAGDADRPSFSPDGRRLAFIGTDVDDPPDDLPPSLWVMDLRSGTSSELTAELDRPIGEWAWCDLLMAEEAPGPTWLSSEELGGHRRRPGPRRPVPRDARRDGDTDDRPGPADRRLRPGRRRRSHRDLGRARRPRRGGLGGRGRRAAPGDPRGVGLAAPVRRRRSRGAQPARSGGADPGLARLAARRRPEAPADDSPHPRRPDGSLGPGWHARRDGAVRGRLSGADAEHPRIDDVRRPVGPRPVRQLGRHRRRGRARIGRRPREAGPRRPEAARGDGPELRRLPDPVAHRRHRPLRAPQPARTGSPTRHRPGRTRTSACTTTAAPASAIR